MEVLLHDGSRAIVDQEDWPLVRGRKWERFTPSEASSYARTFTSGKQTAMHRILAEPPRGAWVDHADGDGLNNRRSNIRVCSPRQNAMNKGRRLPTRYSYKGIGRARNRDGSEGRWKASITLNRKAIHLGYFDTDIDAARAYDDAAVKHFGEFARTNVMLGLLSPLEV